MISTRTQPPPFQRCNNGTSSNGLWDTTGWWNAANCVEAVENEIIANNDSTRLSVLQQTFNQNAGGNFLNNYYDDEGWWANAWIRAYDLTGNDAYLSMAKTIFADMTGGWDDHCGGGIWWSKDRTYKNAIPNELFLLVAIRLHQRTPGDGGAGSYFYWATNEWSWFKASGMINAQNLINDGLTSDCQNNGQTTWSYNQGVILGGLADLYQVTGDTNYLNQAEVIADAAISRLVLAAAFCRSRVKRMAVAAAETFRSSKASLCETSLTCMTWIGSPLISISCIPMRIQFGSTTGTVSGSSV